MTVTVQIETNTTAGLKLITELRRYPDIVRFVEPDQISEPVDIESLSANDSAKLAFDRLGEKYDRKFNNKYTR
jgi:hypothetical protein